MKIKRYLDKNMRHALRRVREDQGPDAVILSNRRVENGIEVIAAIDYDEALVRHALGETPGADTRVDGKSLAQISENNEIECDLSDVEIVSSNIEPTPIPRPDETDAETANSLSMQEIRTEMSSMRGLLENQLSGLVWKDTSRRFPIRAQLLRNLARIGLAPDIANMIIDRMGSLDQVKNLWSAPLTALAQTLPVVDDAIFNTGGTIALIGPTGVGKTTTIAKIAARFAMENWADDIALVSADSYRIGAKEHLMAFANIIGTQVHSASSIDELSETLARLKTKKLVLIDTEGRSQRDRDLTSRLAAYGRNADRVRFFLTLSAATQEAALDETVREFNKVPLEGCVITKIDEAAQLGCAMSTLIRNDLPAVLFSDGQRIPDDLHAAARKKLWLVNQAIGCLESSRPRIDERTMAENYAQSSVAHA